MRKTEYILRYLRGEETTKKRTRPRDYPRGGFSYAGMVVLGC